MRPRLDVKRKKQTVRSTIKKIANCPKVRAEGGNSGAVWPGRPEEFVEVGDGPVEVVGSPGDGDILIIISVRFVGVVISKIPTIDMRVGNDGGYVTNMLAVPSMFVDVTVIEDSPAGVGTENECKVGEWRGKIISALGESDVIG